MTVELEEIRDLVVRQLGLREVADDDWIVEDLGADSVDVMNIVAAIEERYRIRIEESEVPDLRSVADLAARVRRGLAG